MRGALIATIFLLLIGLVAFTIWRLNESTTRDLLAEEKEKLHRFVETELAGDVKQEIDRARPWLAFLADNEDLKRLLAPQTSRVDRDESLVRIDGLIADVVGPGNERRASDAGAPDGVGSKLADFPVLGVTVVDAEGTIVARGRPDGGGVYDLARPGSWSLGGSEELEAVRRTAAGEIVVTGPRPRGSLFPSPVFPQAAARAPESPRSAFRFGTLVFSQTSDQAVGAVFIDVDVEVITAPLAARMESRTVAAPEPDALAPLDPPGGAGPPSPPSPTAEREATVVRRVYLVDRAGRMIFHPDADRRLALLADPDEARRAVDEELPVGTRALIEQGRVEAVDIDREIVALAPVASDGPGSRWVVVATVPHVVLTRVIRGHQDWVFRIGIAMVILVASAAFFMTRLLVAQVKSRTEATYLRRLLSEREASERFLTSLFNAINDPIVVQARDYRILRANRGATERYGEDLLGKTCYSLYRTLDARSPACERDCPVDRVFETGKPYSTELRDPNTGEVSVVSCYPLQGTHGEVWAVIEHCRDVTESKRLEDQLVHNERLSTIGEMAAGVAHEINNPIGAISMFAQLLAEELVEADDRDEEMLERVRTIEANAEQVGRIAKSLLDFSRKSSGGHSPVHMGAVMERALGVVSHQNLFDQVTVHRDVEPGTPPVLGDEGQLVQVVVNLAINAAHAMPDGGALSLRARVGAASGDPIGLDQSGVQMMAESGVRDDAFSESGVRGGEGKKSVVRVGKLDPARCTAGTVELSVRDSGSGIPRPVLKKIFDPFYTTKAQGKGTGLGLAVTFGIIGQHGGRIEVESEEGAGTCFTITLPAHSPEATRTPSNGGGGGSGAIAV